MDVRINEVNSQVHALDSQTLLDPRILQQIVQNCLRAVKEHQAQEKRMSEERRLSSGVASDDR